MVHGAILAKGEPFYTSLGRLFGALENAQRNYNWLITGSVCYPKSPDLEARLSEDFCWLSGEELTAMIREEDFQWIWGVLSGFPPKILLEDVLKYPLPCAEEYEGFFQTPLSIQHPMADVEIAAIDSSYTLFFSRDKNLADLFRKNFPLSEDLAL